MIYKKNMKGKTVNYEVYVYNIILYTQKVNIKLPT